MRDGGILENLNLVRLTLGKITKLSHYGMNSMNYCEKCGRYSRFYQAVLLVRQDPVYSALWDERPRKSLVGPPCPYPDCNNAYTTYFSGGDKNKKAPWMDQIAHARRISFIEYLKVEWTLTKSDYYKESIQNIDHFLDYNGLLLKKGNQEK